MQQWVEPRSQVPYARKDLSLRSDCGQAAAYQNASGVPFGLVQPWGKVVNVYSVVYFKTNANLPKVILRCYFVIPVSITTKNIWKSLGKDTEKHSTHL
ncbi:hypothetical protein XELAEV_18043741mg [Xenopus laevis]|uniref:Uncharacterized protein n=1 Tax=Xenopus laevis TaxID=8355 RepID=A0A974H345_XENLA|nr:hypothetical protein XELAEV_18043741mg [Xenopus laevis]